MQKVKGKGNKLRLDPIFPGDIKQLDFSSLPEKIGWDWAEVLGHKQEFLRHMTILRVYQGTYGLVKGRDEKLIAGGLELHIQELDKKFAEKYPMKIHVVCNTFGDEGPIKIKEEGWKGELTVHPISSFGSRPKRHTQRVVDLARTIDADVIHMHNPRGMMAKTIARKIEVDDRGFAITFHSQPNPKEDKPMMKILRSTDLRRSIEVLQDHLAQEGFRGVPSFLGDVFQRLRYRVLGSGKIKKSLYDLTERRGHTSYVSYSLIGVSEPSCGEFGDLNSFVIGKPINVDLFDPQGVSNSRKDELIKKYGLQGKKVMMYHARINPAKGQDYLPEVAEKIKRLYGDDFKIILIGTLQDPRFLKKIQGDIERRGLQEHFVFEEAKDQKYIRDLLSVADVFLFPTTSEGAAGSGIEAQLMELPIVAHNVGGIPSYVIDDKTGYLVDVGDTDTLAEKTAYLLRNPSRAREMGKTGRPLSLREFSSDKICLDYVTFVYGPQVLSRSHHVKK